MFITCNLTNESYLIKTPYFESSSVQGTTSTLSKLPEYKWTYAGLQRFWGSTEMTFPKILENFK